MSLHAVNPRAGRLLLNDRDDLGELDQRLDRERLRFRLTTAVGERHGDGQVAEFAAVADERLAQRSLVVGALVQDRHAPAGERMEWVSYDD